MNSLEDCPVAQAYGSWASGITQLRGGMLGTSYAYGFNAGPGEDRGALDAAWEQAVARRRSRNPLTRLLARVA